MSQQNYVTFIDESGTLPDPSDLVVVIAAVVADPQDRMLERLLARVRSHLPRKGKRKNERQMTELKFYKTSSETRKEILRALAKQDIMLCVLVVEKQGRRISDSAENYARLVAVVLKDCLAHVPTMRHVWLDRHFTRPVDDAHVKQWLAANLETPLDIRFVDSAQETRIDLADFVAGAVLFAHKHKDPQYEDLIRGKIAAYRVARWSEKEKW